MDSYKVGHFFETQCILHRFKAIACFSENGHLPLIERKFEDFPPRTGSPKSEDPKL